MNGIYGLQNKLKPEKWYIGSAYRKGGIISRWNEYKATRNCKGQKKLHPALLKYGYDGFEKVILEECPKELIDKLEIIKWLDKREEHWISHYDSFKSGYNCTKGGGVRGAHTGFRHSEETKKKLADAQRGRKHTEEFKKAASDRFKGIPFTPDHKEKIANALRGVPLTDERKKNISASLVGQVWSDERRKQWSIARTGIKRGHYKNYGIKKPLS